MKTEILNIVYKLPEPVLDFLGISKPRTSCRIYNTPAPEPDAVVAAVLERNPKTIHEKVEALLFYACARMRENYERHHDKVFWLEEISDIENGAILDPTKSKHTLNVVWWWFNQYCVTAKRKTFDGLSRSNVYEHMVTLANQRKREQQAEQQETL